MYHISIGYGKLFMTHSMRTNDKEMKNYQTIFTIMINFDFDIQPYFCYLKILRTTYDSIGDFNFNKHCEILVSCSDEERNCMQAQGTACKLM